MGDIKVYGLDTIGVVVDTNVIGNPDGTLTKSQNAIADPIGEAGSIRKRPGLKPFTATAAAASVVGAVSVPFNLGSAAPIVRNPFIDSGVTALELLTPIYTTTTIPPARFDDQSWQIDGDPDLDIPDIEDLLLLIDELELEELEDPDPLRRTRVRKLRALVDVIDVPEALTRIDPDAGTLDFQDGATDKGTVPILLIGQASGAPAWELVLNTTATEHITSNQTLSSPPRMLPFPSHTPRQAIGGFAIMSAGASVTVSSTAACLVNNKMYYVSDGFTSGSTTGNPPTIRCYDGLSDTLVLKMPNTLTDLFLVNTVQQINNMISHDGIIYFTTHDGGIAAGVTAYGSVYSFDPSHGTLQRLGPAFAADSTPFSLCWAYGRIWMGMISNTNAATVYSIRPADSVWALEYTFDAGVYAVSGIVQFQGLLYFSLYNRTLSGTVDIWVRAIDGTYSAADTGTLDTNGAHVQNRGYGTPIVWPPENNGQSGIAPALYVARSGATEDTFPNIAVRKLTAAGVWSTATILPLTASTAIVGGSVYDATGTIVPALWSAGSSSLYNSIDGTTWVDRSAQYTLSGSQITIFPSFTIQA